MLQGVLPHRFEQPIPPSLPVLAHDQRLVHQPHHHVQHVHRRELRPRADRLRRLEGERPREDRQPAERRPLRPGEQGVAPVERGAQRLLAGRRHPAAPGEQAEGVVEAVEDLRDGEHVNPGRRQLEGERDAGEAGADAGDGVGILRRQREGGGDGPRPGHEELHRRGTGEFVHGGQVIRVRGHQRRDAILALARDLQPLAAGGEDAQGGAGGEQVVGEGGAGVDQVLAVVEDEERGPGGEEGGQGRQHRAARSFPQAEGGGHGDRDARGIGDRREFDKPEALREGGSEVGCKLQGEAGLAAAADTGEGEQPLIGVQEQIAQRGEFGRATDQRGARCRQPGAEEGLFHRVAP